MVRVLRLTSTLVVIACGGRTAVDVGDTSGREHDPTSCPAPEPLALLQTEGRLYNLVVDRTHAYVAVEKRVLRVSKCGGTVETLVSDAPNAFDLDVWAGEVYFTNQHFMGNVSRVAVTGGTATIVFTTDLQPEGIRVAGGVVYATAVGGTQSASLLTVPTSGGMATTRAVDAPRYVAADDEYVYAGGRDLRRIPHHGGPPEVLVFSAGARDVAIDEERVYWLADYPGDASRVRVLSVNKFLGGIPVELFVTTSDALRIAADPWPPAAGGRVYFVNHDLGTVIGVAKDGSSTVVVTDDAPVGEDVAADATSVYWISFRHGTLNRRDRE